MCEARSEARRGRAPDDWGGSPSGIGAGEGLGIAFGATMVQYRCLHGNLRST